MDLTWAAFRSAMALVLCGAVAWAFGAGREARAGEAPAVRVLNNFVSELLSVSPGASGGEYAFTIPRKGWVYFRTERSAPAGGWAAVYLDMREFGHAVIEHGAGGPQTLEAMLYLPEGERRVWVEGTSVSSLVVRAVPEIQYST